MKKKSKKLLYYEKIMEIKMQSTVILQHGRIPKTASSIGKVGDTVKLPPTTMEY